MTATEVRSLPAVVDVVTAAEVLGIGRTVAYELVRTDTLARNTSPLAADTLRHRWVIVWQASNGIRQQGCVLLLSTGGSVWWQRAGERPRRV